MFEGVESGKSYFQNSGKVLLHFLLLLKRILFHTFILTHALFPLTLSLSLTLHTHKHTFSFITLYHVFTLSLYLFLSF